MTISKTEKEITLVICSERAQSIGDEIAQFTEIQGYSLHVVGQLLITDSYLDTHNGLLKSAKWALRLREIDGSKLITLKGPPSIDCSGLVERLEIEDAWSPDAFHRIMKEIRFATRDLSLDKAMLELPDPMIALDAVGFHIVQTRKTSRRVINILEPCNNRPTAEMAVDAVEYRFDSVTVRHYETELESKSEAGVEAVRKVAYFLQSRFGNELRLWPHSKLETGRALESLLNNKSFNIAGSNLSHAGYDAIDAMLKTDPQPG